MTNNNVYDSTGQLISSTPMSPEDQAKWDAELALETLRAAVRLIITDVKSEIDLLDLDFVAGLSNTTINGNPAKYIKTLERATRKSMRAVIDLSKLVDGKV